ncbi:hypothetical protein PIB30_099745 [Stylosanthes scabra]|uniref:Uncharacterized protein n=1 Tax=Stylosanthes scabra TaxID=79078 RepID=A0ABU6WVD5_9FABA|nr:hypothetical protein [Stylosanthes scabra]
MAGLLVDWRSCRQPLARTDEASLRLKMTLSFLDVVANLLNSKPGGAKGADIDFLAQYTIEVLRSNLTNTVNLLKSLTANSSDHTLVNVYYGCLGNLNVGDGALGEIDPMQ